MKICMIGTGYVGLVTGTCFAELGFDVTCVDVDRPKIDRLREGIIPIYEPGLESLVRKNTSAGRLKFSYSLKEAVPSCNVVFIAVGTPPSEDDGQADLKYVFAAAEEIAEAIQGYTVIVTKSTVPVDTAKKLEAYIRQVNPGAEFDVVSNPEFLREGSAIEDFMNPDRVVIGCRTPQAEAVMRKLYNPFFLLGTPIVFTSPESSELIKYAANSFLAAKITFINQVADLCEQCGADVHHVAHGIGLDSRIGKKFLNAGPGYGGSCFPKDTMAMAYTAQKYGTPLSIVEAVIEANEKRKIQMASKIKEAAQNDLSNKKVAILGVTFKPDTDDMRDSPSLTILPLLQKMGATLYAYDPVGMKNASEMIPGIHWKQNAYDTLQDADVLVLLTEWNEFRHLDLEEVKKRMKTPLVVDLRNIYRPEEMVKAGFVYYSIGRQAVGS
ncbi:MAG: UDP-glucose dehydrogenase family protein [Alphaproteobacteria bacterium]